MISEERKYRRIYKKARSIMGERTPLKKDCGLICGGACCKGDDNTGMLLFPHETSLFKVNENDGIRLAVCQGKCDREERPISCMVFPFFPYINEKGKIEVQPDLRGRNICPMIYNSEKIKFDRGFLWRLKKLGRYLSKHEECRKFLWEVSREIDLIRTLTSTETV